MSAEERRLLARIADLRAMEAAQRRGGDTKAADRTANEIRGLELELTHVRGTDPGRARS